MSFLNIKRKDAGYRPVQERVCDFGEVEQTLNPEDRCKQASRCMNCGVPFCHWACPLGNRNPEWQEALAKGKWQEAYKILSQTNNFPEFTGRICPALCEKSCVLSINDEAVTCRENEVAIVERAFAEGWVKPNIPAKRNGKKVAVVGSGPAGLAAAAQLNQFGCDVTVFEKDEAAGGLLRFGIPDFKLQKNVIERRIKIMEAEGIKFQYNTIPTTKELNGFDAVALCIGSGTPRDLNVENRNLKGIHFALELLQQQNRVVSKLPYSEETISAKGKKVLVIGGGDTGSDCVGTAVRHGAASVMQIEIMPMPPEGTNPSTPWPEYPIVLKTSSSHKEGCERRWSLDTLKFEGEDGVVKRAIVDTVVWENGRPVRQNTPEVLEADLVLLALGFVHPVSEGLVSDISAPLNERKNIVSSGKNTATLKAPLFAAGDAAMGASLVVRAIADGRKVAQDIINTI